MPRRNPFPTHGLVVNASDRNHLMVVDLSEPTPGMIYHLIDRLRNRSSIESVRDYCEAVLEQRAAAKRGKQAVD